MQRPCDAAPFYSALARLQEGSPSHPAVDSLFAHFLASFPLVLQLFCDPAFPFPLLGALHVRSDILLSHLSSSSPPSASGRATCRWDTRSGSRLTSRGVEVSVRVELGGWAATHTFLFFAHLPQGAARELEAAAPTPQVVPLLVPSPSDRTLSLPLQAALALAWSALTQDYNPIHVSPLAAWLLGFRGGGVVAHGMSVLLLAMRRAVAGRLLTLPARDAAPLHVLVYFSRPLFLPDEKCSLFSSDALPGTIFVRSGLGRVCSILRVTE